MSAYILWTIFLWCLSIHSTCLIHWTFNYLCRHTINRNNVAVTLHRGCQQCRNNFHHSGSIMQNKFSRDFIILKQCRDDIFVSNKAICITSPRGQYVHIFCTVNSDFLGLCQHLDTDLRYLALFVQIPECLRCIWQHIIGVSSAKRDQTKAGFLWVWNPMRNLFRS